MSAGRTHRWGRAEDRGARPHEPSAETPLHLPRPVRDAPKPLSRLVVTQSYSVVASRREKTSSLCRRAVAFIRRRACANVLLQSQTSYARCPLWICSGLAPSFYQYQGNSFTHLYLFCVDMYILAHIKTFKHTYTPQLFYW